MCLLLDRVDSMDEVCGNGGRREKEGNYAEEGVGKGMGMGRAVAAVIGRKLRTSNIVIWSAIECLSRIVEKVRTGSVDDWRRWMVLLLVITGDAGEEEGMEDSLVALRWHQCDGVKGCASQVLNVFPAQRDDEESDMDEEF